MNAIKKTFSAMRIRFWLPRVLGAGVIVACFAGWVIADEPQADLDLTVHEWGTFTAVAGKDGRAMEWTTFGGPSELPGFVEHIGDVNSKQGLRGTIRMETPVMYFYSPREVTLSVKVAFAKGVITEWYPHASRVLPSGALRNTSLNELRTDGRIAWSGVDVSPSLKGDFPRERSSDRYYAARETSATPLRVQTAAGEQQEKFLFYRGASAAPLSVSARQNADGTLLVTSLEESAIPAMILFERRGKRIGYRVVQVPGVETVVDPPELTGDVGSVQGVLEEILTDQGLYADEAHAMVKTWQDSWFEEGSRLIYIVPRDFVDRVLPLSINPQPGRTVRVFVGRLEIVTPATERAVETAMAARDDATLSKYRRFLEPILQLREEERVQATR
jgi:hypothetical protein